MWQHFISQLKSGSLFSDLGEVSQNPEFLLRKRGNYEPVMSGKCGRVAQATASLLWSVPCGDLGVSMKSDLPAFLGLTW